MFAQSQLQQRLPSPELPKMNMSMDQYRGNLFPETGLIVDFQHMIQGMQNPINTRGDIQTDEVMSGSSHDGVRT